MDHSHKLAKRARTIIGTSLLLVLMRLEAQGGVIYQAFNERFVDIVPKLSQLKTEGYEFVQVSPPVKSIDDQIWWGRYQPIDYRVIEGPLGNLEELQHLIQETHERGLKILVDLVLNHMADPVFHNLGLNFPEFAPWDFHYFETRPCIDNWASRHQVTKFWLCDPVYRERRLPDLDTASPYVREVHKEFLLRLSDLGFDGFRIDAAKHIEPEYFRDVLAVIPYGKFYYGEVIGETLWESKLYTPYMQVTDFHMLRLLLSVFRPNGDMRHLIHPEGIGAVLPQGQAILFARNHDTAMHPTFFNFGDYQDSVLANVFLLSRGVGTVMIYRDDQQHSTIKQAMEFNKSMAGKSSFVRDVAQICYGQAQCDSRNLLLMERGGVGFALINKANRWLDIPAVKMPGLNEGCYRETRHGFTVTITKNGQGQKWITRWGSGNRGGVAIGPRSALMFKKIGDGSCL
jgi:alpha-amylase